MTVWVAIDSDCQWPTGVFYKKEDAEARVIATDPDFFENFSDEVQDLILEFEVK